MGRRRAAAARTARDAVISETTSGLDGAEADALEALLAKLVAARVAGRIDRRRQGEAGRMVVPHLRLRGLRPTGGPLPGPGHRGSPVV